MVFLLGDNRTQKLSTCLLAPAYTRHTTSKVNLVGVHTFLNPINDLLSEDFQARNHEQSLPPGTQLHPSIAFLDGRCHQRARNKFDAEAAALAI